MKRSVLLALALALAGVFPPPSRADQPAPSASTAGAVPSPRVRSLVDHPPPRELSPPPSEEQWQSAEHVALARPLHHRCQAQMIREWLRVRCEMFPHSGAVVLGPTDDVTISLHENREKPLGVGHGEVIFPMRPGPSRLIHLSGVFEDLGIPYWAYVAIAISFQWPEDEPSPIVTTTPNAFQRDWLMGMHLGTSEEGKAKGLPTHHGSERLGYPMVLAVDSGSLADRAGARAGDYINLSQESLRGMDEIHERIAFQDGDSVKLILQRGAAIRPLWLPLRR